MKINKKTIATLALALIVGCGNSNKIAGEITECQKTPEHYITMVTKGYNGIKVQRPGKVIKIQSENPLKLGNQKVYCSKLTEDYCLKK